MIKFIQVLFTECIQNHRQWRELWWIITCLKFQFSHQRQGVNNLESAAAHLQNQKEPYFPDGLQQNPVCMNTIKAVMDSQNKLE